MFFNQTKRLKVKDIMSKDFIVFDSDISLRRCVEHIALNNLKEVIVRHHEKLAGYIKFDDIIKISLSQSFPEKKLFDIRANKPFYLNVEDTVLMAKDIMRENQVDRVFILDDEKLVGVLRTQDIVYKLYPKIQANEDVYELLWDNVHEGMCIIDNKGTVCIWGRGNKKLKISYKKLYKYILKYITFKLRILLTASHVRKEHGVIDFSLSKIP